MARYEGFRNGTQESLFGHLDAAQMAMINGNNEHMVQLESVVIPMERVVLTKEQIAAEVFNSDNYERITGKNLPISECYIINNKKHRLYHLDVIAIKAPVYNKDNRASQYKMVYVDRCIIPSLRNKNITVNKDGYAMVGRTALHNVVTSCVYVHHRNCIRTDDYLANLEASSAFLNSQDKLNTNLGLAGICKNSNLIPEQGKVSKKIFQYTTRSQIYSKHEEYIIAAINKYLVDLYTYGETYHNLDNFMLNRIAAYTVKYTGLYASHAYFLYKVFLEILDCRNSLEQMLIVLNKYGIPVRNDHSKCGMYMIDNNMFMEQCRNNNLFIFYQNGKSNGTYKEAYNSYYGRKGRILTAEIKKTK